MAWCKCAVPKNKGAVHAAATGLRPDLSNGTTMHPRNATSSASGATIRSLALAHLDDGPASLKNDIVGLITISRKAWKYPIDCFLGVQEKAPTKWVFAKCSLARAVITGPRYKVMT